MFFNSRYVFRKCNLDRIEYDSYKAGILEDISSDKELEMKTLSLLEQIGFSMNDIGTYLYKNMVVEVAKRLRKISNDDELEREKLLLYIRSPYSQFYVDVARNDLDMGIKTFHEYVDVALSKVDLSAADNGGAFDIYNNFSGEVDYGEQLFTIGSYVANGFKSGDREKPIVKKKITMSNV